jgi:hypothetical protein
MPPVRGAARRSIHEIKTMRLHFIRVSIPLAPAVAVLSAIMLLASFDGASAQYIYQPAPDYYQNDQLGGTVAGGALGAVTGAIVGGRKNRGEGALIGAGVGAITGNLLGANKDRADERRAAAGAAYTGQLNQQAAAQAVTNYDLAEMTRAGVSEEVIISTMRSRGTRIDLSPNSLIALKQSGVSDRVVLAAQDINRGGGGGAVIAPAPVVTEDVPSTRVIVAPAPWYYGPYPHYHRYYYGPPHAHFYYHGHF